MIKGVVAVMLMVETISDIKTQSVSGIRIGIFTFFGIILNLLLKYQNIWSAMGGAAVGIVLILYALLTKGAMGIGDGFIFICLGIYLGFSNNLRLLFLSLLLAAVAGGIYAFIKKKSIKTQIPFMPYILVTYAAMTLVEVAI